MSSAQSLYRRIRAIAGRTLIRLGFDLRLRTTDRVEFEQTILPWFRHAPGFPRLLFIGCDWYTKGYARLFADREYWTLEIDPDRKLYGGPRHITDSATNIAHHFGPASLDVVFLNGVFGWGIDDHDSMEKVLNSVLHALRRGGVLLIGWDNRPDRCPFPLTDLPSYGRFRAWNFPPYGENLRQIPGEYCKVYEFLTKP